MKRLSLCLFLLLAVTTFAQPSDYWQQHVSYTIDATLIDSNHSVDGKLSVIYTNNSPDTLKEVYFHLYNNAFKPGSMMHERAKALNDMGLRNKFDNYKPGDQGGYTIYKVSTDGSDARYSVTGTIMKVVLASPLAPKASVKLGCDFHEQIPLQTRRNGWMNADSIKYSMAQWYPKVCEYDREGWHNQEYISREFYGVWGEFDVTLHVPSFYCVGATGQCQNPKEVGWGYDSIASGVKKGKFYPNSPLIMHYPALLTWHFKAENVHDFAWVAHEYIHEWDTWNDTVTVHCLYKLNEEKLWAEAMKNTFFMLEHHSKKVGWYQYRNFTNTHGGDGGMEYPQLVMDGSPNAGLIMHEGGHQWFYGMLGNNETRYAFLDEGFTEFIEMVGMEAYYGRNNERSPYRDTSWLTKMFIPEYDSRRNYYSSYLDLATSGYEEPLYIPHDWARESVNAGQVYMKTLSGLAQLEYVMGDSVFWAGMKEYFRRWHYKHPSLLDFQRTMEDVSGTKLDWYFDQWFHTTRTIDYSADGVSSDKQVDGSYKTTVKIENDDVGVMPLDLTLRYDDGTTGLATIPLALNQSTGYQKPETGRLFFPSWDWVKKEYEGTITTPKEVSWYEIDSSCRLMDVDRDGNAGTHPFLGIFGTATKNHPAFLTQWQNYPPLDGQYSIFRPIIWYDEVSKMNFGYGVLVGVNRKSKADFKILYTTGKVPIDESEGHESDFFEHLALEVKGSFDTKMLGNLSTISIEGRSTYGMVFTELALDHHIRPTYRYLGPDQTVRFYLNGTFRGFDEHQRYPVYGGTWDSGGVISGGAKYGFTSQNGSTRFGGGVEIGQTIHRITYNPFSQFPGYPFAEYEYIFRSYTSWSAYASQLVPLGSEFSLSLRGNITLNTGEPPEQKLIFLNQANPSEQDRSIFWKAVTSVSSHFSEQAHFFMEGGGGARGYRNAIGIAGGGGGLTAELQLPNPISKWGWLPHSITPLLFGDAGYGRIPSVSGRYYENILGDAGLGFKVNLLSWLPWQLQGVAEEYSSIPSIGIYFPFIMYEPDPAKKDIAFRYVISIGTTF